MIIGCDNKVEQPGIFSDSLHFDMGSGVCNYDRDVGASMYILKSHGANKFECLHRDGNAIEGHHYIGANQYWGTIEYRLRTHRLLRMVNQFN